MRCESWEYFKRFAWHVECFVTHVADSKALQNTHESVLRDYTLICVPVFDFCETIVSRIVSIVSYLFKDRFHASGP